MFEIYLGTARTLEEPRLYYWHFRATNGKLIADGAEGYATRASARRAVRRFIRLIDNGAGICYV